MAHVGEGGGVVCAARDLDDDPAGEWACNLQGLVELRDGLAVAQLAVIALSPRVHFSRVSEESAVEVSAADLHGHNVDTLHLLGLQLVRLVSVSELSVCAVTPSVKRTLGSDRHSVPGGAGDLLHCRARQLIHRRWQEARLFAAVPQLALVVASPRVHHAILCDGGGADVAACDECDLLEGLHERGAAAGFLVTHAEPAFRALSPGVHLASVDERSGVEVSAGHLEDLLTDQSANQQRCKAVPLVPVPEPSLAAGAPSVQVSDGVECCSVRRAASNGADILAQQHLDHLGLQLVVLVAVAQAPVHTLAPRVHVAAVLSLVHNGLCATEGDREPLAVEAIHLGELALELGGIQVGVAGDEVAKTNGPDVKLCLVLADDV
mmetsp:Transcript_12114/g.48751  ORF Transcript_12114/g.48751 Transcript_12114/m.48751 type:complete len:378 (-) Transcript_12114:370-1503(-)